MMSCEEEEPVVVWSTQEALELPDFPAPLHPGEKEYGERPRGKPCTCARMCWNQYYTLLDEDERRRGVRDEDTEGSSLIELPMSQPDYCYTRTDQAMEPMTEAFLEQQMSQKKHEAEAYKNKAEAAFKDGMEALKMAKMCTLEAARFERKLKRFKETGSIAEDTSDLDTTVEPSDASDSSMDEPTLKNGIMACFADVYAMELYTEITVYLGAKCMACRFKHLGIDLPEHTACLLGPRKALEKYGPRFWEVIGHGPYRKHLLERIAKQRNCRDLHKLPAFLERIGEWDPSWIDWFLDVLNQEPLY